FVSDAVNFSRTPMPRVPSGMNTAPACSSVSLRRSMMSGEGTSIWFSNFAMTSTSMPETFATFSRDSSTSARAARHCGPVIITTSRNDATNLECGPPSAIRQPYRLRPRPRSAPLLLQLVDEPLRQAYPDLVLFANILAAMVEVRIVVHLDHEDALRRLLDVDAIEPVADAARGAHRNVQHFRRRFAELEAAKAALFGAAVAVMVDDLPVLSRHQVLDREQRLAAKHTDPPVKRRRQEFLRDQQVGIFKPLAGKRLEFVHVLSLLHAARESAIGDLQHQRKTKGLGGNAQIACSGYHHRGR